MWPWQDSRFTHSLLWGFEQSWLIGRPSLQVLLHPLALTFVITIYLVRDNLGVAMN